MAKKKKRITATAGAYAGAPNEAAASEKPKRKYGLRIADGGFDMMFFILVIVLLAYGLVMVFSASYMEGLLNYGDGYRYVKTQAQAAVIGIVIMLFISIFDYHILLNSNLMIIGYGAMLLLLTYTSFFGTANAGAHRWIELGSFSFQPSEAMKPVLIIFLAFLITKNQAHLSSFKKGSLPLLFAMGPVALNMVLQRHISGLLIMCALFACVVVLSGMKWMDIVKLGGILLVGAIIAMLLYSAAKGGGLSYISDRVTSMGSVKEGEINDDTWQTAQSLIAIGSGGWFGLGFGESRQKYLWLPESQNDFIIAIIVEELGYIGGLVVLILFGLLIWRGFTIARKAPDKFGMLIVSGITFQIGLQAILNIGVACNAFPNTGVSLPFFSSGGSALVIQLVEMGVILAVSRKCENV